MSSHRAKKMSASKHQRECHKFLTAAGYAWVKTDSHEHNHYHHHADRAMGLNHIIVTVSSPYSDSEGLKRVRDEIRRHDREREAHMATRAGGQIVSNAQIYANMADAFLLKDPGMDKRAIGARHSAFIGWVKRVLEKHGPVNSADFEQAAGLIGFAAITLRQARQELGAVAYRAKGEGGHWMAALPHQVPERYQARDKSKTWRGEPVRSTGVDPVMPDPVDVNTQVPSPALVEATSPQPVDDTRAAALMLLESMGFKAPSAEALMDLGSAKAELEAATHALQVASAKVADAIARFS